MAEVMVCPACNSQDIWKEDSFKFENRCGLARYRCRNCGYNGPMTLMEKKGADKLKILKPRKDSKKTKG